jgi:hypothetical protein
MTHETDIRFNLQLAIIDREAAKERHRAGYAVSTSLPDMQLLDKHLKHSTDDVTDLMQELGAEQTERDARSNTS